MNIRKMFPEDIETVVNQELEVFGSTLGTKMLNYELGVNQYAYYYVVEKDDQIIGYIGLWCVFEKGQITNFYIMPDYRGEGIGNKVILFALNHFDDYGVKTITLEVRESNSVAFSLYQKHGFTEGGIRKNYYENGENARLMIKNL